MVLFLSLESDKQTKKQRIDSPRSCSAGSDSLSGILSPRPHNHSTEDLLGGSSKRKQSRCRHASAEVQPRLRRSVIFICFSSSTVVY